MSNADDRPAALKATVAAAPHYVRSGRALVVPCAPELAGEIAIKHGALTRFREMYGDPVKVLYPGRPLVVELEVPPRYVGKARLAARIDIPGAAVTHALEKFNADTLRRQKESE